MAPAKGPEVAERGLVAVDDFLVYFHQVVLAGGEQTKAAPLVPGGSGSELVNAGRGLAGRGDPKGAGGWHFTLLKKLA